MARWAQDHQARFADSDPDVGELMNRMADNWRPLFVIADVAGGHWPKRVREIAAAADRASTEQSVTILLLQDIRWIFDGRPELENGRTVLRATTLDRISSADLVTQLTAIEERPWAEWKAGKPITQNGLARILGKFEIIPQTIRLHVGQTAKGYYRSAFEDVFSYYLASQTVTTSQLNNDGPCDALQSVTPNNLVTLPKTSQLNNDGPCDVVTVSNPPSRRTGSIDL
jgi:hypothetical protein